MYKRIFKPILDFLIALIGIVVLSPVIIIVIFALTIANKGKPFFLQSRPGKHEKYFKLIKFRSMNDKTAKDGELLPDAERLTKTGRFVRKTSLDEVPQLINVLKGDMSLVGPRPLLGKYLELYSPVQKQRHDVRPGITGWAQVKGRNALSWTKKFELDVWYVDHLSFLLDVKILLITLKKVFLREGISQEGQATIEVFNGDN